MRRGPRRAVAGLGAWLAALVFAFGHAPVAGAASGSYASAGSGTYAASLWWLDFAGYSNATASGGGQAYSWSLPNGAGTLATTLSVTGNGTLVATGSPAWSGGGAIGHGAYNGIAGSPALYWLSQPGSTVSVSLGGLSVRDAQGNARSFALYVADAENTNSGESITYTTSSTWKLVDSVTYFPSYSGGAVTLAGVGGSTVTETAPTSKDGNYNSSVVLGTLAPASAGITMTNNEAVVFAVAMPTVSLTVNVASRLSASDQFSATIGYTSPSATLKVATSTGTATTLTTGSVTPIGSNSLTLGASMAAGSASSLSYYTGSIACTNAGPGSASLNGSNTVLPAGAGTSFTLTPQGGDNISCTLTLTPATQALSGTVYLDTNHDAALDNGETGAGLAGLYVKLAPATGSLCQPTATAAAAVTAATGSYSLPAVAPGSYCLTLTNSSALTNTTPYVAAGYVATEASGGVRMVSVGAGAVAAQNFGLYNGTTLGVVVFDDSGAGAGTASDGVQNGAEAGLSGLVVVARSAAGTLASATTLGSGAAQLWLPASAVGSVITVTPTPPAGYAATGGSAGNTGGAYARPSVTFTLSGSGSYAGVTFGLVPGPTLAPDNLQTAQPGTILYYAHTFVAGSAGSVAFTTTAQASPVLAGWSEVLFADASCSGQFVATDAPLAPSQNVVAGQTVCVLLREFVPATAPAGAQDKVVLSATFTASGVAAPAAITLTRTDTTTVAGAGAVTLAKQVQNLTLGTGYGTSNSALPGHLLQYQLTIANPGSSGLAAVVVNDATPAYTTFVSAACPPVASLPPAACMALRAARSITRVSPNRGKTPGRSGII